MPDADGNWPLPKLTNLKFLDDFDFDDIPPSFLATLLRTITTRLNSETVIPVQYLSIECCEGTANSIFANGLCVLVPHARITISKPKPGKKPRWCA